MNDIEGIDGVTDEQFHQIYFAAWQDAITAVQVAASNGTLVERFLDGKPIVYKGLEEFDPETTSNPAE